MKTTDYCDPCKGEGCKACGYTGYKPQRENGWTVQHVIEFIGACIMLVFALITVGILKLFGKEV